MNTIKKHVIFFSFCALSVQGWSQTDTLVMPEGNKIAVIITEITSSDIIYRIPNKPDLPLFHFKRNNVSDIIFKDGSSINPMFNTVNPYEKKEYPKARTIVYFTPTKLLQNHIGFAYEHIFRKNYVGIRVPVSVAYTDITKFKPRGVFLYESDIYRRFTAGLDLNIYPLRLGKFKYVTGISVMYAKFAYKSYFNYNHTPRYETRFGNHYSFLINNGFIAQPTKHFVVSATMGVGFQSEEPAYNGDPSLRLNTTLNVGYLF
jgi:hypothetical protein